MLHRTKLCASAFLANKANRNESHVAQIVFFDLERIKDPAVREAFQSEFRVIRGLNSTLSEYQLVAEKDAASGYAGLNASLRITDGVFTSDDVIIDFPTKGLVLRSGDGHYWRVTIDATIPTLVLTDTGVSVP